MLIKKKYMIGRFGSFKSIVYRWVQLRTFKDVVKSMILRNDYIIHSNEKISNCKDIYEYLYKTTDIWTDTQTLSNTIKNKLFDLSSEMPYVFQEYLSRFGYICPYLKLDGKICGKKVNDGVCKRHSKCSIRLKTRISTSIECFPPELSNIVCKYVLQYS
jgi:hypothetical protein